MDLTQHKVYIGLGGNLNDPLNTFRACVKLMKKADFLSVLACSSVYQTSPIGYRDQPDFLNAVVLIETTLSPDDLLQYLQTLETHFGRKRTFRNAPRTLDLDMLLYDDKVLEDEHLTLPHPALTERAFVLTPLLEISPDIGLPSGEKLTDFKGKCCNQTIECIASPDWCQSH